MPEHEPVAYQEPSTPDTKPPIYIFHEKVKSEGTYREVDEQRRILMEEYFTTNHTFATLAKKHGIPRTTAQFFVSSGLHTVFDKLPPEMQQEYISPKNVIQLKPHKWKHNEDAIMNVREAQQRRRSRNK